MSADVRAAWAAAERVMDTLNDLERDVAAGKPVGPLLVTPTDLEHLCDIADAACACGGHHYCEADVRAAAAAVRVLLREFNPGKLWAEGKRELYAAVQTLRPFALRDGCPARHPKGSPDPTEGTGFDMTGVRAVLEREP